ncbi:MAG: hypothetical protein LDL39_01330, partial [Magnetospirillum sp.]|nr:hypothetical protein [Magnetospirillum sp.]
MELNAGRQGHGFTQGHSLASSEARENINQVPLGFGNKVLHIGLVSRVGLARKEWRACMLTLHEGHSDDGFRDEEI